MGLLTGTSAVLGLVLVFFSCYWFFKYLLLFLKGSASLNRDLDRQR